MKILKRSLLALAAVALMTACSEDKLAGGDDNDANRPEIEDGEGVFMSLQIKMPTAGSRSQTQDNGTSNSGTEPGSDAENNVSSVLIVLADANNNIITASTVIGNNLQALGSDTYNTVAKFQKTQIADYYNGTDLSAANAQVNVFVFCNPTQDLTKTVLDAVGSDSSDWLDTVCTVDVNNNGLNTGIWSSNAFLMNNSEIATRKLPLHLEDWNSYKTSAKPFHLSQINNAGSDHEVDNGVNSTGNGGPIKVERSVARFDFKDGSGNTESPNTYGVLYGTYYDADGNIDATQKGPLFVNIELQRICLTNMAKQFYYLPRVSPNGAPTGAVICGQETPTNYTVSPNYTAFNTTNAQGISAAGVFNYPFFNSQNEIDNLAADDVNSGSDRWSSYYISDVLNGPSDNYGEKAYHVWRYCTENAIPGPVERETYGRSTIVVFKGKIVPTEAAASADTKLYPGIQKVAEALNTATGNPTEDAILYSHGGILYATWEMVRAAVQAEAVQVTANGEVEINRNSTLYMACYGTGGMGTFTYEYTHQQVGDDGTETTVTEELTYEDSLPADETSANAAWTAWKEAGKPDATGPDELLTKMRKAMTTNANPDLNFTLYQSSTDNRFGPGYYCYYYYRNRHNDNLDNGVMGPMEFAVVRNNVYKLTVTNINKLGHPRLSVNDPDAPDPDTPDETDNVYIDVECQVLPWTVRINNIEF